MTTIRQTFLATSAVVALAAAVAAPALARDTEALVNLLASKGVITSSEAQAVTSLPASAQEDRLVALLRKKGVLGAGDVTRLQSAPKPAAAMSIDPGHVSLQAAAPAGPPPVVRKAPVQVGGFEIEPVGYIALTSITRSTNASNGAFNNIPNLTITATSFGTIPFTSRVGNFIGETRLTAQNTLLGLRAHTVAWGMDLTGYVEMDFNGNDAANVFVNTNGHTERLRLAYMDINSGQLEASAGQMWSWITPNRRGLGPDPRDVFTTNNIDQNLQVGLPWARQAAARVVWHPTPQFSVGIGAENPQQFTNGEVTFPQNPIINSFNDQFDNGSVPGAPNKFPDVVAKAAFDSDIGPATRLHLEAVGMWRHFEVVTIGASLNPDGSSQFPRTGTEAWLGQVSGNIELFNSLTLLATGFWGNGGGRYLGALGPDVVVMPTAVTQSPFTGMNTSVALSPVQSRGYVLGAEWRPFPTTILSGYYGQASFDKNTFIDITSTTAVQPLIGFGGKKSSDTNNKLIQEWTVDLKHTFWADPRWGAVQGLAQYSFVRREPHFVGSGAPESAHVHMLFTELRYAFPER